MKLYLTFFLIVLSKFAFCQTTPLTVKQIDSVAMEIDSAKNPYSITEDGTITFSHKGIIKKIFGKHAKGGYGRSYYGERKTGKLLKVAYDYTLDERVASIYYYLNDSLMLFTRSRFEKKSGKKISDGRFYFQQGHLIAQSGNDLKTKLIYVLSNGRDYLKQWQKDFIYKRE